MAVRHNDYTTYGAVSRNLHWLMALCILLMFVLGWGLDSVPGPWKPYCIDIHKSLGIFVLLLAGVRLGWRAVNKPPLLPEDFSVQAKLVAHLGHAALYALMFIMPLSGWAMISAMGRAPVFLNVIPLPPLFGKNPSWVPFLKESHEVLAYGFAFIIAGHVAAAFYHHFIVKDGILLRMMPPKK